MMKPELNDAATTPTASKNKGVLANLPRTTLAFMGALLSQALIYVPLCLMFPAAIMPCMVLSIVFSVLGAVFLPKLADAMQNPKPPALSIPVDTRESTENSVNDSSLLNTQTADLTETALPTSSTPPPTPAAHTESLAEPFLYSNAINIGLWKAFKSTIELEYISLSDRDQSTYSESPQEESSCEFQPGR